MPQIKSIPYQIDQQSRSKTLLNLHISKKMSRIETIKKKTQKMKSHSFFFFFY
jgi:hypothetical protein